MISGNIVVEGTSSTYVLEVQLFEDELLNVQLN